MTQHQHIPQQRPETATLASASERAVMYLHAATKDQATPASEQPSIVAQRAACLEHCNHVGLTVVHEFADVGHPSGSPSRRPMLRRMHAYLKLHPEVGYVVVERYPRLSRDWQRVTRVAQRLGRIQVQLVTTADKLPHGSALDHLLNADQEHSRIGVLTEVRESASA